MIPQNFMKQKIISRLFDLGNKHANITAGVGLKDLLEKS
jgi:hypothetical protein